MVGAWPGLYASNILEPRIMSWRGAIRDAPSSPMAMGHYSHAGRGPRKLSAGDVRKASKARSKLDTIALKYD